MSPNEQTTTNEQNFHSMVESTRAYLLLTQVPDASRVLLRVGSTHYCSINRVAENNERNFYMHIIVSNIPKRKKKIPSPSLTLGT